MTTKSAPHPAIHAVLEDSDSVPYSGSDRGPVGLEHATSVSLARALVVGGLSRLDSSLTTVNVWDPAAGLGFAGYLLVDALQRSGAQVRYRGQDINEAAVAKSRRQFEPVSDAEIAHADTLARDAYEGFRADLVIVDAPWGMDWQGSAAAVGARQKHGEFGFGLPKRSDSTWLFISLALEKLRPTEEGGGRVAALVNPSALSSGGATADVRERIVEAGLLESVTRLPDGLAPNTAIPLYLLTFSNKHEDVARRKAMIANLQTEFTTERQHRSMPVAAFRELESGLRTGKPGPRNRSIDVRQFTRRDTRLERASNEGTRLSWRVTTYADTPIDDRFLESRYGPSSGVSVVGDTRKTIDLDPSRIFRDDSRELLKDIEAKGWKTCRLSSLIAAEPALVKTPGSAEPDGQLYVPTTREGKAAADASATGSSGRVLSIWLDDEAVDPTFLTAWLNSEQGVSSRRRAIEASSTGAFLHALRSDSSSLMRWADELIVPVPDHGTQLVLASADERLASFEAELSAQRESVWASPESAEAVVSSIAGAFDDSLSTWLDQLPYPIASALWTAETASSPGEQQRAYIHAWEAIVTFHATVLLSASRTDLGHSGEVEAAIGETLRQQHLGIERASFGTWVIIIERVSKEFRRALEEGDADEIARVRRSFADLGQGGIERLVSKDLVKKVNEVNTKRNRWLGHTGYTSDEEWKAQVVSLVSDLSELRQILGNVWAQLLLVRAGSSKLRRDGRVQTVEVAVGTRSPFKTRDFIIGDEVIDGDLYLAKDGSQSPLPLGQFVQLRAAPQHAQYTTYFYNRTEGASVRMVSYQHGPESEIQDDAEGFRSAFGGTGARMTLTLDAILRSAGLDPAETQAIRHAFVRKHENTGLPGIHADSTGEEILAYTRHQSAKPQVFPVDPPQHWVVFIREGGDRARLWSVLENRGEVSNDGSLRTFDLAVSEHLADFRNRLVIGWRSPRTWRLNGATAAGYPVMEIADAQPVPFPGFDRLVLDRSQLQAVMREHRYAAWRTALSSVVGVYLITDTRDGRQYVGKADGAESIRQRWNAYAANGHGGNVELRNVEPSGFRYSILRVFDPATPTRVIDETESHFKLALDTRKHGLNRN